MSDAYDPPMMDQARVIQVIETTLTRRGDGKTSETAIRLVTQYWSMDGRLLAEVDPTAEVSAAIPSGIRPGGVRRIMEPRG